MASSSWSSSFEVFLVELMLAVGEHRHISEIEIGTQPSVVDTETMAMDTDIMTVVRVGRDQNIAGPDTRLTTSKPTDSISPSPRQVPADLISFNTGKSN